MFGSDFRQGQGQMLGSAMYHFVAFPIKAEGKGITEIAKAFGIGRASIYRALGPLI
jgi:DNA-binding phage protein